MAARSGGASSASKLPPLRLMLVGPLGSERHKHVADMATAPWYGRMVEDEAYSAGEFLSVHEYENVIRWNKQVSQRPTVQGSAMLCPRFAVDVSEHHPRQTTPRQSAGVVAGMDCPIERVHCETRPEPTS